MSEFDVFGGDPEAANKRAKCRSIGLAIGLGLAAAFVLGSLMIFGMLLRTVMDQASDATNSLRAATVAIQGIEKTASDFNTYSQKKFDEMQKLVTQMQTDLDTIAKKVKGMPSVTKRTLDGPVVHRANRKRVS